VEKRSTGAPVRATEAQEKQSRRLGHAIDGRRDEIERRWLARVQSDIAPGSGVELTQLRDGMPHYLASLVDLLHASDIERAAAIAKRWEQIAREHGVTRVRIGFDITQLIHEFIVLRHVIAEVALEEGIADGSVGGLVSDLLDGAITASVRAYVGARDYESRRNEAEKVGFLIHELRNPLSNAILAATQLRIGATEAQVRTLEMLDRAHRRLMGLIDGVLMTGKLESGAVIVKPVDVKLADLVESALEAARASAKSKHLDFRVVCEDTTIHVDPELTRSAIQNIADNAAKYTDHGHIEVTTEETPSEVSIHVRDSCGGISDEELAVIFEPFKRGLRHKAGTGLGLTIARRAVESQGGSIHAESIDDFGCHFWIVLPKRVTPKAET
jgi:signal transduction histidine kinase